MEGPITVTSKNSEESFDYVMPIFEPRMEMPMVPGIIFTTEIMENRSWGPPMEEAHVMLARLGYVLKVAVGAVPSFSKEAQES